MPNEITPALLASQAVPQRRGLEPLQARCQRAAWNRESASQFVNHLLKTHHPHLDERLRRVERAIVYVAAKHGLAHGSTWSVANIFVDLAYGIRGILEDECLLLGSLSENEESAEMSFWRSRCDSFVGASESSRQEINELFREIRSLTSEDEVTKTRCPTYHMMLDEVASLEKDYRTHSSERKEHLTSLAAR